MPEKSSGPSWTRMLLLLALAILAASIIAYRMVYPFFHPHYSTVPAQSDSQ